MDCAQVRAACHAMGTRFEIILWGDAEEHLRAAAREALDEVLRIHHQLNVFDPSSDVSGINRDAWRTPVKADPRLLALVERCRSLWEFSRGAFDITLGRRMVQLGFRPSAAGENVMPETEERAHGMDAVVTDLLASSVRFGRPGIELDFGAVGKGYALDEAASVLRACGVGGGLLHGGTSSVLALGTTPGGDPWRVAVPDPAGRETPLAVVALADNALGVSASYGRTIRRDGDEMGHVLDPRTGMPVYRNTLAAVACSSATEADALSTALLVLGGPFATVLEASGYRCWLR